MIMANYDVAMWLRSENTWPEMVLVVQAETASDAVIVVLHARRIHRAVKVAVNAGDGCIHRWYGMRTLVDGFGCQRATCLPMGWSEEQQALVPRGGES
jgi:hypothetical protein